MVQPLPTAYGTTVRAGSQLGSCRLLGLNHWRIWSREVVLQVQRSMRSGCPEVTSTNVLSIRTHDYYPCNLNTLSRPPSYLIALLFEQVIRLIPFRESLFLQIIMQSQPRRQVVDGKHAALWALAFFLFFLFNTLPWQQHEKWPPRHFTYKALWSRKIKVLLRSARFKDKIQSRILNTSEHLTLNSVYIDQSFPINVTIQGEKKLLKETEMIVLRTTTWRVQVRGWGGGVYYSQVPGFFFVYFIPFINLLYILNIIYH